MAKARRTLCWLIAILKKKCLKSRGSGILPEATGLELLLREVKWDALVAIRIRIAADAQHRQKQAKLVHTPILLLPPFF